MYSEKNIKNVLTFFPMSVAGRGGRVVVSGHSALRTSGALPARPGPRRSWTLDRVDSRDCRLGAAASGEALERAAAPAPAASRVAAGRASPRASDREILYRDPDERARATASRAFTERAQKFKVPAALAVGGRRARRHPGVCGAHARCARSRCAL